MAVLTPNTSGAGETNIANNTAGLNGVTGGATTTTGATANSANVQVQNLTTSASSAAPGAAVTVNVTFGNAGPNSAAGRGVSIEPASGHGHHQCPAQRRELTARPPAS